MFIGFDTSNYTTSVAVLHNDNIEQQKQLLSVKQGEKGLRQSDAVFQHTVNMPILMDKLDFEKFDSIEAVGVSTRPRSVEGSYMPCFLVGENVAVSVAKTHNVPLYKTSHQVGHILAALYSCDAIDLIDRDFIAFHLSGGTTEALLVTPDEENIINTKLIAQSSDLKAGQAIDRVGVMLGMQFPCGKALDELSKLSDKKYNIKPSVKGADCSLSGVENKAKQMLDNGENPEDIANFVLSYICKSVESMLCEIICKYGDLPVVFSGGVSSNSMLREVIKSKYNAYFAKPEYSCDNASGVAIYARLKHKRKI